MRAVRLEGVGELHVHEVEQRPPAAHELVVRVEACGICGTDRHILRGEYPAHLPVTLGHEFAGEVVVTGIEAALPVGTRIAVDPNIACGSCRECRRGDVCLCPRRVALGVDLDGGLAEYAVVPASQAYPLPPDVPAEWGALCEPLACCLRGLDLAGIRPGMSVAILGGGVIGQLMVQLARLAGAVTIILATRQAGRRALAESLGATATVDPRAADVVAAVAEPDGLAPGGVDVALECAGAVETFEQAVALARRGGTVLVFGVAPQGAQARISPFDIFARELRIVGSYLNPLTHGRAVELVASGRLALTPLVTRQLALEEVPSALAAPPEPGEVKIMVLP
jgi:2-desacetyl-2-hydroxyethyl bacteriochlorophyllide A dehydrogenase